MPRLLHETLLNKKIISCKLFLFVHAADHNSWLLIFISAESILYLPRLIMASYQTYTRPNSLPDEVSLLDDHCQLIVWNDDVNTFDWVIQALVEICGHTPEQAEQCAIIIDSKGKYAVKEAGYEVLKPMCGSITDRGINATIEVVAF
jgi:ATP-dependent Clp protease adaptor protein ClpS